MNTHKAFILGLALLGTSLVKAQFTMDAYKAVFTTPPQHVPTTKTPDAPLAGNGDIGITMGGTPDKLCFYIGNKFNPSKLHNIISCISTYYKFADFY